MKGVNYTAYREPALVNGARMMKRMIKDRGEKLTCGGGLLKMSSVSSKWLLGVLSSFHIKMIKVPLKTEELVWRRSVGGLE